MPWLSIPPELALAPGVKPSRNKELFIKASDAPASICFCLPSSGLGASQSCQHSLAHPPPAARDPRNCSQGSRGHRARRSGCCVCPPSTLSSSLETGTIPQCGYGKREEMPWTRCSRAHQLRSLSWNSITLSPIFACSLLTALPGFRSSGAGFALFPRFQVSSTGIP